MHELIRRLAAHRVADQDRDLEAARQVGQREDPARRRDMARRADLRLDEEEVGPGIGRHLGVMPGRRGGGRHRRDAAGCLHAADHRANQVVPHRRGIRLGEHVRRHLAGVRRRDPLDDRRRVLVPRVEALEIDEGNAARAAHPAGERHVGHGVHGRGQERDLEAPPADRGRDVDLRRVDGHLARHEGNLLEPVRTSQTGLRRVAQGDGLLDQSVLLPLPGWQQDARGRQMPCGRWIGWR